MLNRNQLENDLPTQGPAHEDALYFQQLKEIFKKHPEIFIDKNGVLSILVPLTSATLIDTNFSSINERKEPISLYLFGDNTCKSDLEMRKFFGENRFSLSFEALMEELSGLATQFEKYNTFTKTIIFNLSIAEINILSYKTDFQQNIEEQKNLLRQKKGYFLSKAEFQVSQAPDDIRRMRLPNVTKLQNLNKSDDAKLTSVSADKLLLSKIKIRNYEEELLEIIKKVYIGCKIDWQETFNNQKFELMFEKICQEIYIDEPVFLKNINIKAIVDSWKKTYFIPGIEVIDSDSSEKDIIESIFLILKEDMINKKGNTFHEMYSSSVSTFETERVLYLQKKQTFRIFITQTFLYLCAININLKNSDKATQFLNWIQDEDKLENYLTLLQNDEESFIKELNNQWGITKNDYQSIIKSTYSIVLAHKEANHFDELRTACMPLVINNAHYIIINGRLCWSYYAIDEISNIVSANQQTEQRSLNFDYFRENYENYEKVIEGESYLSERNLIDALCNNNVHRVKLILENTELSTAISPKHLEDAIKKKNNTIVALILNYRPDLIECNLGFQQTPFVFACAHGNEDTVKILMRYNPIIYARTLVPLSDTRHSNYSRLSRDNKIEKGIISAKDWAKKNSNLSPQFLAKIFSNPKEFETILHSDSSYKDKFNEEILIEMIVQKKFKEINILFRFRPDLSVFIKAIDLEVALKQKRFKAVEILVHYRPDLIEELSTECIDALVSDAEDNEYFHLLIYKNPKLLALIKEPQIKLMMTNKNWEAFKILFNSSELERISQYILVISMEKSMENYLEALKNKDFELAKIMYQIMTEQTMDESDRKTFEMMPIESFLNQKRLEISKQIKINSLLKDYKHEFFEALWAVQAMMPKSHCIIVNHSNINFSHIHFNNTIKLESKQLYDDLVRYYKDFSNNPSPKTFENFQIQCKEAIKRVDEACELQHQKYSTSYKIHSILLGFLGIMAALLIIPALIIKVSSERKYKATFFPSTESSHKIGLNMLEKDLQSAGEKLLKSLQNIIKAEENLLEQSHGTTLNH